MSSRSAIEPLLRVCRSLCALTSLCAGFVCACAPETPTRDLSPVLLLETAYLEPPAIKGPVGVYRPAAWSPIGGDESNGRAAAFFVSVALTSAANAQMRLVDINTGTVTAFVAVAPPPDGAAGPPSAIDPAVATLLAAGQGVFWLAGTGERAAALEQRLAVLIPELRLSAFTRLQVGGAVTSGGVPALPAEIELVREFFYLAVIGDSIQWGNGLLEADKMSTLASTTIERETGRKVILQRYAHSGARIVPAPGDGVCEYSCFGEVPVVSTSITRQADQIQRPELLDVVLMDGCINDVTLATILSPVTEDAELTDVTTHFCDAEMTTLLRKICALAPQAHIVVTGYFQIVSDESDPFGLTTWNLASGLLGGASQDEAGKWVAKLSRNSVVFRNVAHAGLQAAVQRVNEEAAGPSRVRFADPQFGPENCVFTSQRWLWSASDQASIAAESVAGLQLFPEDPLASERATLCNDGLAIDPSLMCLYASLGHPNPAGARAYTTAVIQALRALEVLPAE